jgi:hypothetical protein
VAEAIIEAQIASAKRREQDLGTHLQVHGVPDPRDLGVTLAVLEMFAVSDAAFDRLIEEVRSRDGRSFLQSLESRALVLASVDRSVDW